MTNRMDTARDYEISWLRDAFAMEQQALDTMNALSSRLENYPDFKARVEQHITETERQRDAVRDCLIRYGSDASSLKTGTARMAAMAQGLMQSATADEVVKGLIALTSFEHYEATNYKAHIAAADALGDQQLRSVMQSILDEELAMAHWCESQIPTVIKTFLTREAVAPDMAKR